MAEICLKSSYSIMCGGVYSGSSCLFYQLIIRSVVLKIFCFLWSKFLRALGVSNLCSIALQFRLLTPQCMSDCTEPQLSEARLRSVRNRRGASNSFRLRSVRSPAVRDWSDAKWDAATGRRRCRKAHAVHPPDPLTSPGATSPRALPICGPLPVGVL